MVRVALFASGNGSNVENIYKVFDGQTRIKFPLLVSNQEDARVVKRAELYKKNIQIISKRTLSEPTATRACASTSSSETEDGKPIRRSCASAPGPAPGGTPPRLRRTGRRSGRPRFQAVSGRGSGGRAAPLWISLIWRNPL